MPAIRVLLVDDHPVVLGGLQALLDSLDGFEVVGTAADGEAAVRAVVATRPDVVLMDVRMPGIDGVEATRRAKSVAPEVAILMLTMHDDDATVLSAIRAGASGYVLKGATQEEIDRAIRAVLAGEVIFGPGVARAALGLLAAPPADRPFPDLTGRERDVLDLLAAGKNNAAIAGDLFVSPKTVANHISSIFAKLQVASRAEAIVRARREGLGGD